MNPAPRRTSTTESGDDSAWVRAAQRGDEAAFGEIVKRYQRAVYRVAYGLTRNPNDADDLAQETFLRAYQAIDRFRAGEPLYPWLSRITVNLAYSLFRRRKRRPESALEPMLEAGRQWAAEDDPAEDSARHERERLLGECFEQISEEHRAVLVLRVVEEMSYDEIARTLSIPMGTVMSRLSRARAELKTRMKARTGENA